MFRILRKVKWGRHEFELLMKNLSEGMVVQDRHGNLVFVNDSALSLLKIKHPGYILGKPFKTVLEKFTIKNEFGKVVKVSQLPPYRSFKKYTEYKQSFLFKKGNNESWLRFRSNIITDEDGEIEYIATAIRDVTLGKQNEVELAFKRKLLEAQGEASIQGVLAVDKNQTVVYVNSRLAQLLNVDIEDLENKNVSDLFKVGKDNFLEFDKFSKKALQVGKSKTRKAKGTLETKNSKIISYYTAPLVDKNSEFIARVWFFEDRTYALKTEQQREAFISIATHELKNPLTTVRGYSEFLVNKKGLFTDKKGEKYAKRILEQTDKVIDLVDDLLDITQVRAGTLKLNFSNIDIGQLINETVDEFKNSTKHRFWKGGNAKKMIFADRSRLKQVLYNLLSNAVKYTPEKETIRITLKQDDKNTTIAVKDGGPGIGDKDKNRVFDLYVRGKNKSSGHGIGLYVSQAIIKGHNGRIWIESEPGHGANFIVSIPNTPTAKPSAKIF